MKTFSYAAYGSNLHPLRLMAHDRCPTARLRGTSIMPGWRLAFRKRSADGSAKCDADKSGNSSNKLWIAVFDIPEAEEAALDNAEGLGSGYNKFEIKLRMDGENITAKIYLADKEAIVTDAPYDWYKEMVYLGAEYHSFPIIYTDQIQAVVSKIDHYDSRAKRKWREVEQMKTANNTLKHDEKQSLS